MDSIDEVETYLQIIFNRIRIAAAVVIIKIKPGGITARAFTEKLQSNLRLRWQNESLLDIIFFSSNVFCISDVVGNYFHFNLQDDLCDPTSRKILSNDREKILSRLWEVLPPEAQISNVSDESDSDIFSDYGKNDASDTTQDSDSSIAENLLLELNAIQPRESKSYERNSALSKCRTCRRFLKKPQNLSALANQSSTPLARFEADLSFIQAMIWLKSATTAMKMVPVDQFRKIFKKHWKPIDYCEPDDFYKIFGDERYRSAIRTESLESSVHDITFCPLAENSSRNSSDEDRRNFFNAQIEDNKEEDHFLQCPRNTSSADDCSIDLLNDTKALRINSLSRRNRASDNVDASSSKLESPVSSPERTHVNFDKQNSQHRAIIPETDDENSPSAGSQEMENRIMFMSMNQDSGFNSQKKHPKAIASIDDDNQRKDETTDYKETARFFRKNSAKGSDTEGNEKNFITGQGTATIVKIRVNDSSASDTLPCESTTRSILKPMNRFKKKDKIENLKYVRFKVTEENVDSNVNVNLAQTRAIKKSSYTVNKELSTESHQNLPFAENQMISVNNSQFVRNVSSTVNNTFAKAKSVRSNNVISAVGKCAVDFVRASTTKRSCTKRRNELHSKWKDVSMFKRPRFSGLRISSASLNYVIRTSDTSNVLLQSVKTILRTMENEGIAINYSVRRKWHDSLEKEALEAVVNLVDLLEMEKGSAASKNEAVETIQRVFDRILKSNELGKTMIWNDHTRIILELCNSPTICYETIDYLTAKLKSHLQQADDVTNRPRENCMSEDILIEQLNIIERSYLIFHGLDIALRKYRQIVPCDREDKPEEARASNVPELWKRNWKIVENQMESRISEKDREENWTRTLEEIAVSNADDRPEITLMTWKCLVILKSSDND